MLWLPCYPATAPSPKTVWLAFVEVAAPATKRRNAQARECAALWQKFGRRPFLVLAFIDFSCLVRDNLQPMF
jgi:hypothetical protein